MQSTKSIMDSIRRIVRSLRMASRASEKAHGLSAAQLFVLHKLREGSVLSINELAERTFTDQSSVSVVVSRLVDRGFILRTPSASDARRAELRLSTTGQRLIKSARGTQQEVLVSALGTMTRAERDQLALLLYRFTEVAGLIDGEPPLFFEDDSEERT